jgi:two-component system, sensor histidine kinase PdtaS
MHPNKKILIVEDEGITALEIQNKVEEWGYTVAGLVSSGEEAVKTALEKKPDLILMDIVLKEKLNGIEASKIINKTFEVPIIYLTAYGDEKTLQRAKITIPQAYILKPFEDNELKFAIEMGLFKHEMEIKLKQSEEKYRTLAENARDMIFIINLEDRIEYVNKYAANLLGLKPEELIGNLRQNLFPMDISENHKSELDKIIENNVSVRKENKVVFPKCDMWLDTRLIPLKDKNDVTYAVMGISRDITHRKKIEDALRKSLKEKEVLLKEIHHRVKNNMQIISSLISLQTDYADNEDTIKMFEDSKNRIRSMALIHEKLYQSDDISLIDFSDYIESLASRLLEFYGYAERRVGLKVEADNISLSIDSAIPCGLIINELVSNSIKHAFPGERVGMIKIGMHKQSDEYVLTVEDNGIGFPEDIDFRKTDSLGLQIVQTLTLQLGGQIELQRNGGTKFQIIFKEE